MLDSWLSLILSFSRTTDLSVCTYGVARVHFVTCVIGAIQANGVGGFDEIGIIMVFRSLFFRLFVYRYRDNSKTYRLQRILITFA